MKNKKYVLVYGSNRTENTLRNIMAGLLNRGIAILLPFINRTLIIMFLGAEVIGLNSLLTSVLGVLNLAEMGFSVAIVYSMYEPMAHHDREKICWLLTLYRKIYRCVGFVILFLGIIISPFLPYMIAGELPAHVNIYVLYFLYLFDAVISYFMFAYKEALVIADQRRDISQLIRTVVLVFRYIFQLLVLILSRNIYVYVLMAIIGTVITNLVMGRVISERYPEYVCVNIGRFKIPESIKKQVGGLVVDAFCDKARNAFDSIILSAVLGLTEVAIYNNYYYIYSALYSIILTICNAMSASVGNSVVTESVKKNYAHLLKFSFMQSWLSGWISICMLCLYQPFMYLWVGEKLMLSEWDMALFCFYFYAINLNNIRNQFISGTGIWWKLKITYFVEALSNLVLNIILGNLLGTTGIILASIITIILMNFIWRTIILFKSYFQGNSIKKFLQNNLLWCFITVFVAGITYYICGFISVDGVGKILANIVVCLIIPNMIFLFIYSKTKEFQNAREFLFLVKRYLRQK